MEELLTEHELAIDSVMKFWFSSRLKILKVCEPILKTVMLNLWPLLIQI